MTRAYSELYLDDAMENLADMFECAVDEWGYDADEFFWWFIRSELAEEFGQGNPKYLSGMSGIELAEEVIYRTTGARTGRYAESQEDKSETYWAGWSLAYYQWYSGRSFRELYQGGLTMTRIMSMYLLHEADISKFVEEAEKVLQQAERRIRTTRLQTIRKARGMTQQQLSEAAGVTLRMIQLYEQRKNDINCAAVSTVKRLATVLGCRITDLME